MATSFDSQVESDSSAAGGDDYAALTSLAARQAFGALEFTNTPEVRAVEILRLYLHKKLT
jgi:hypothetical protein